MTTQAAQIDALRAIKEWTLRQDDTVWFDQITTLHDYCDQALTAAAEVGPLPQMVAQQNVRYEAAAIDRAIADTIDHCAQVAENFEWGKDDDNTTLAARIRALKDEP
jgi:hypothetical protein